MSKIRFRSLPSAEFSIAVAQAGAKAELKTDHDLTTPPAPEPAPEPTPEPELGRTPDLPPPDPGLKAQISANRLSGIAPAGVFFEIELEGFDEFDVPKQDTLIVWDFGDEGAKFADLSGRLDMLHKMDATQKPWNDANTAYGFFVSHVYRKPGPHSIQARVYYSLDASPVMSNVLTFDALDPDEEIPLSRTIYASNDGDFSGVPAGVPAGNRITTSNANDPWAAIDPPRRLLYKEGHTFDALGTKSNNIGTTVIGSWGPGGGRAIWDTTKDGVTLRDDDPAIEFVMGDIICQGSYSMATQTGTGSGINIGSTFNGTATFDNVKSAGCNGTCFMGENGKNDFYKLRLRNNAVCYIDCEASDWRDYGWFGGWKRVAFLGTWTYTPQDAFAALHGHTSGGAAMRIEAFGEGLEGGAYFGCADIYCAYGKGTIGHQPPLKVQGDSVLDSKMVIDRVILEGNNTTNGAVGSTSAERQFALYDKVIHIGDAQTGFPFSVSNRGTTLRNLACYHPNTANWKNELKATNNNYMVAMDTGGSTSNKAAWFNVHSFTYVRWNDVAKETNHNANIQAVSHPNFGNTKVANGIIHVPFDLTPQVAEVDTSVGAGGIALYPGRRDPLVNGGMLQTQYATADQFSYSKNGATLTDQHTICIATPTGANLTADAGEKVAFDYIDGTPRGRSPAKGAFKP